MQGFSEESSPNLVRWDETTSRCERCPKNPLSVLLDSDDFFQDLLGDFLKILIYAISLFLIDEFKHFIWHENPPLQIVVFVFAIELATFFSLMTYCLEVIEVFFQKLKSVFKRIFSKEE